jgi:hypothetical protein
MGAIEIVFTLYDDFVYIHFTRKHVYLNDVPLRYGEILSYFVFTMINQIILLICQIKKPWSISFF